MVLFDVKIEIIGKWMERLMDGWMFRVRIVGVRGEMGMMYEVE